MYQLPLGDLLVRLTGDSTQFERMISNAEMKLQHAADKLTKIGTTLTAAVTAPLTAVGAVAVKKFADFDDAMTKSVAIMGAVTDDQKRLLRESAIALSRETSTSATDLAQAYYYLASAGLDVNQTLAALPVVQRFATAGAFDLEKATSLLADSQSALGMTSNNAAKNMANMARIADVLTNAANIANADVEQFATSLTTKAAANMRDLNISLEEGVAVLAAYAKTGVKAQQAGEKFDIMLRELQNSVSNNAQAWEKFGLKLYEGGRFIGLQRILKGLEDRFAGMNDEQRFASAQMLGFRTESLAAIRPLLGLSDTIEGYKDRLMETNTVQGVYDAQMTSFNQQMKVVKNNIDAVAIEIGEFLAPAVAWVAKQIKNATDWWKNLSYESKRLVLILAAVAAAVGPIITAFGLLAAGASAIAGLVVALKGVAIATVAWYGVIALVVVALALLTDSFLKMTGTVNLGLTDLIGNFRIGGYQISTYLQVAFTQIGRDFSSVMVHVSKTWESTKVLVAEGFAQLWMGWSKFTSGVTNLWNKTMYAITGDLKYAYKVEEENQKLKDDLTQTLRASEILWDRYYKKVAGYDQELRDIQRDSAFAIEEMFREDAKKGLGTFDIKPASNVAEDLQNILDDVAKKITPIDVDSLLREDKRKKEDQKFEVFNLRQFSLTGLSGANLVGPKEQDVKAVGVEKKLDQIDGTLAKILDVGLYGKSPMTLL